jgi:nucleotide-binding universal stress UspA family protein
MLPIKTILHPTDFSERSALAFRLACALARDYGARLVVAHVAEPPRAIAVEGVVVPPPPSDLQRLREQLQRVRPEDPQVSVEHRLIEGDAASEVLHVAEDTKCDLIVMGTHGRRGLGRLLMGSVAEQVVRQASCPVLTVRAPQPGQSPSPEAAPAISGTATANK